MSWPQPPKPVRDLAGLRRLEIQGQVLGYRISLAIPESWRFFLLAFEYAGGGATWVESVRDAAAVASWAERAAERVESGGLDRPFAPRGVPIRELAVYGGRALRLLRDLEEEMPDGWGFVLLVGRPAAEPLYASSADRENVPTLLREFAARLRGGEMRPPGVLGREN